MAKQYLADNFIKFGGTSDQFLKADGSVSTGSGIDVYVTGGTYTNGTATFTNNTGGTFDVTGFSTGGGSIVGTPTTIAKFNATGDNVEDSTITDDGGVITTTSNILAGNYNDLGVVRNADNNRVVGNNNGNINPTVIGGGSNTNNLVFGDNNSGANPCNNNIIIGSSNVIDTFDNTIVIGNGISAPAPNTVVIGNPGITTDNYFTGNIWGDKINGMNFRDYTFGNREIGNNNTFGIGFGGNLIIGDDDSGAHSSNSIFITNAFDVGNKSDSVYIGYNLIDRGGNSVVIGGMNTTDNWFTGNLRADAIIKNGGASNEFLMADGSTSTGAGISTIETGYGVDLDTLINTGFYQVNGALNAPDIGSGQLIVERSDFGEFKVIQTLKIAYNDSYTFSGLDTWIRSKRDSEGWSIWQRYETTREYVEFFGNNVVEGIDRSYYRKLIGVINTGPVPAPVEFYFGHSDIGYPHSFEFIQVDFFGLKVNPGSYTFIYNTTLETAVQGQRLTATWLKPGTYFIEVTPQ